MEVTKIKKRDLLIRDLITPLNGFFERLQNPIYADYWTAEEMDINFYAEYGDRTISEILAYFVEDINGEWGITEANLDKLALTFYNRFYRNWKHLLQVNDIIDNEDWNPLYNYELHVKKDQRTFTPGVKETVSEVGEETREEDGKEKDTEGGEEKDVRGVTYEKLTDTSTSKDKRNVFSKVDPVDTGTSSTENAYKDKTDETNTKTFTDRTSEREYIDRKSTLSFTDRAHITEREGKDVEEHEKDEYGSLGVSSAADQVLKNIEAMEQTDLLGYILRDMAKFLTIPVYNLNRFRYKDYED